jgi:hypothetical protein
VTGCSWGLLVPKSEGSMADGVQGLIRNGVDEFFSPLSTRSCEPEEGTGVGFCIFWAKTCQVCDRCLMGRDRCKPSIPP